jgi:SAM-dependent methyltransferase
MVRQMLARLKAGTEHLNYGREVIASLVKGLEFGPPGQAVMVLDLGMGGGDDLINIRKALEPRPTELHGIDSHAPHVAAARARGIHPHEANIERDVLPFGDQSFDLVVANQVIEHTKDLFWIFSEISRVLRPEGLLVVGVPNLASLHSRAMLALGMQPSPIGVLGPHVRGFTRGGFREFVEVDGYFQVLGVRGSNFYPLPPFLAKPASRILPGFAVSLFFLCRRTSKSGRFIEALDNRFFETDYFRG